MLLRADEKSILLSFYNSNGKLNPKWRTICDGDLLVKIDRFFGKTNVEKIYNALNDQPNGEHCICGKRLKWHGHKKYAKSCSVKCSRHKFVCNIPTSTYDRIQLREILKSKNRNPLNFIDDTVSKSIWKETSYLSRGAELPERIYHILNDLTKIQNCQNCENVTSFRNSSHGYNKFCSLTCAANSKETQNKRNKTYKIKYGKIYRPNQFKISESTLKEIYQKHIEQKITIKELAEEYEFSSWGICQRLNKMGLEIKNYQQSSYERYISKELEKYKIEHICNDRTIISPKELDIVIPSKKIAIEINGIWTHSTQMPKFHIDKNYHYRKSEECQKLGWQLLHFWTSEIRERKDVVLSMIMQKIGVSEKINARDCQIVSVSNNKARDFYERNHLQGCNFYSSINIGLIKKEELVSLMSFSRCRFHRKYEWELTRFASKIGTQTRGSASKLFKNFVTNYKPKSVVSYADKRYSNGMLYETLNFINIHDTHPNYSYVINKSLENRHKYKKHILKNKLENFDANLSEEDNLRNHNIYRVYDCGQKVFIWSAK